MSSTLTCSCFLYSFTYMCGWVRLDPAATFLPNPYLQWSAWGWVRSWGQLEGPLNSQKYLGHIMGPLLRLCRSVGKQIIFCKKLSHINYSKGGYRRTNSQSKMDVIGKKCADFFLWSDLFWEPPLPMHVAGSTSQAVCFSWKYIWGGGCWPTHPTSWIRQKCTHIYIGHFTARYPGYCL